MFQIEEITATTFIFAICLSVIMLLLKYTSKFEVDRADTKKVAKYEPKPILTLKYPTNDKIETCILDETDDFGIDLTKVNYLNMLNNHLIKNIAVECINKHGVGTCSPRGVFGTMNVHLELEAHLANFLGMEEAIIYANGSAAPFNTLLAYCNNTDIVYCDDKINFALEQGVIATKAIVVYFKHNSVHDLERKLRETKEKKSAISYMRTVLLIEGIYNKTGSLCPLLKLMDVAKEYKMKIVIDESISFGILGHNGRGITEHYHINIAEVDAIIGSLEGAVGSKGSFCAGTRATIQYQRLAGTGCAFSCSMPDFQARAALAALKMIESSPEELFRLQLLSRKVHKFLLTNFNYSVQSDSISPYKVFNFKLAGEPRLLKDKDICDYCCANGVHLMVNDVGLILNLNIALYYYKSKLSQVFSVLTNAANSIIKS